MINSVMHMKAECPFFYTTLQSFNLMTAISHPPRFIKSNRAHIQMTAVWLRRADIIICHISHKCMNIITNLWMWLRGGYYSGLSSLAHTRVNKCVRLIDRWCWRHFSIYFVNLKIIYHNLFRELLHRGPCLQEGGQTLMHMYGRTNKMIHKDITTRQMIFHKSGAFKKVPRGMLWDCTTALTWSLVQTIMLCSCAMEKRIFSTCVLVFTSAFVVVMW